MLLNQVEITLASWVQILLLEQMCPSFSYIRRNNVSTTKFPNLARILIAIVFKHAVYVRERRRFGNARAQNLKAFFTKCTCIMIGCSDTPPSMAVVYLRIGNLPKKCYHDHRQKKIDHRVENYFFCHRRFFYFLWTSVKVPRLKP